ncbi:pyridoxal-phosphate dependent enzyme [Aquamicrobium segne]|uniref:Pyridoxal-phosphate dependent enzyme n=1 Tax=Aquamicrobium segne TaxID=469547 RepID=A0ABW0GYU9_9HYPH
MSHPQRPTMQAMEAARLRLLDWMEPTPLVPLNLDLPDRRIFLKLETLSPIGAFKLRPALNAMLSRDRASLSKGVATISSGNMAYGMAHVSHVLGVKMAAYMFAGAPQTKIDGVRRLGGEVRFIGMDDWWRYITEADRPLLEELLINPVIDQAVLDGNGTIGLEIAQDLPAIDAVFVPYGGGSLITGLASALKYLKPEAKIFACEDENAAPVAAALRAGHIVDVEMNPSFIKSIGGPSLLPQIWPVAQKLIDGAVSVSLEQVTDAMRILFSKARVVAEGAGAASLAAALASPHVKGNVVCVISGGNIDADDYATVLSGGIPAP